jgi:curved DNA-binding protein CbpA
MKNYYRILGLNIDAEYEEIKAAYRILAQRHHPDKGGAAAEFILIQEAYDILSNPLTKRNYDTDLLATLNHPLATKNSPTSSNSYLLLAIVICITGAAITFAIWAYLKQYNKHQQLTAKVTQSLPTVTANVTPPITQASKSNSKKSPASTPTKASNKTTDENPFNALSGSYYVLSLGSYADKTSAQQRQRNLKTQGYTSSIQKIEANSEGLGGYNLFMGPYSNSDKALQLQNELESQNINATLEKINFDN